MLTVIYGARRDEERPGSIDTLRGVEQGTGLRGGGVRAPLTPSYHCCFLGDCERVGLIVKQPLFSVPAPCPRPIKRNILKEIDQVVRLIRGQLVQFCPA